MNRMIVSSSGPAAVLHEIRGIPQYCQRSAMRQASGISMFPWCLPAEPHTIDVSTLAFPLSRYPKTLPTAAACVKGSHHHALLGGVCGRGLAVSSESRQRA